MAGVLRNWCASFFVKGTLFHNLLVFSF